MITEQTRQLPDAAIGVAFLLFFLVSGGGAAVWIQWRLERVFYQLDPSGLTSPFIPLPD